MPTVKQHSRSSKQMHRYNRFQVVRPHGMYGNFGHAEVEITKDPDWVKQAIQECWFSVSKTRGPWQVYLPYLDLLDILGRERHNNRYQVWMKTVDSVADRMCLTVRSTRDRITGVNYFVIRFGTWSVAEQFVFLMGLEGYMYMPTSQAKNGP